MTRSIINLDELDPQPMPPEYAAAGDAAERYAPRIAAIGERIGASKLGYNLTVLPPGKRAFPFHSHRANEELFVILEGRGEIRIGTQRHALRAGDIVACPAGGPDTAHQILNTSDADLRYLAVSTQLQPEIVEYPDSGKFSATADYAFDGNDNGGFRLVGRRADGIGYWDGE